MTCWKKNKLDNQTSLVRRKPGERREVRRPWWGGETCRNNELERIEKVTKSVRGMPWLSEATKDVISCDKLRGGANNP